MEEFYGYISKCKDPSEIGAFNSVQIDDQMYIIEFISKKIDKAIKQKYNHEIVKVKKIHNEDNIFIGYEFIEKVK